MRGAAGDRHDSLSFDSQLNGQKVKDITESDKEHVLRLFRAGFGPFEIWERTGMSPGAQFDALEELVPDNLLYCKTWTESYRISLNLSLREFEGDGQAYSPHEDAMRRLVHFLGYDHELFSEVKITESGNFTQADALSVEKADDKIHCYEIKCRKSDLIRELENPKKSLAARLSTHFWWFAFTGPRFEYSHLEIPDYAGIIELHLDSDPVIVRNPIENTSPNITPKLLFEMSRSVSVRNMLERICLDNAILRDRILSLEN